MKYKHKNIIQSIIISCLMCCWLFAVNAQTRTLSGKVVDSRFTQPVAGAEVTVPGKAAILTDANGEFKMDNPSTGAIMSIRAEGYQEQEIIIDNKDELVVALRFDDMITLPYQQLSRNEYNGSIATISGSSIEGVPVFNLSNAISGRLAGMITMQSSGDPGHDAATMWIRGLRTSGSSGNLVLVDGHERDFSALQANEIESISIIKDASTAVLFGMRAANGIISVVTKKGYVGKPRVQVNAQVAFQQPIRKLEAVNAYDFAQLYNEARENDGLAPFYPEDALEAFRKGTDPEKYPNVDWTGLLLKKTTLLQKYNINVDGGGNRARYFVTMGVINQPGMFKTEDEYTYSTNSEFTRYNFRANFDFDVTKTTKVDVRLFGWFENKNFPGNYANTYFGNTLFRNIQYTPAAVLPQFYADNGKYVDQNGNKVTGYNGKINAETSTYSNPWSMVNRNGYTVTNKRYGSIWINVDQDLGMLTPGLSAGLKASFDVYNQQMVNRVKQYGSYQLLDNGTMQLIKTESQMNNSLTYFGFSQSGFENLPQRKVSVDVQLNYNRHFEHHHVNGMLFYSQFEIAYDIDLPQRYQGIGGRLAYEYANRYFADFSFTYQGSYKFAPDHKFGFFPAGSLGWNMANEGFWDYLRPMIGLLKLRVSAGLLGNDRGVSAYDYLSNMGTYSGPYFGTTMTNKTRYLETQVTNPDVTWEKVFIANAGLDMAMLNDRLSLSVDFFLDKRKDIYLYPSSISSMAGYWSYPQMNMGKVKSMGTDLSLTWSDSFSGFQYFVGGTYSFSRSEIIDLDQAPQPYEYLNIKGRSVAARIGLVAEGIFNSWEEIAAHAEQSVYTSAAPGDIKYKDINGDGVVDVNNDRVVMGKPSIPEMFYGLNLGASYYGFDLSALFQAATNVSKVLGSYSIRPFLSNGTIYTHQLNRWTPETAATAEYPRFTTQSNERNNYAGSTFWLRNGNYLRLKNLEIGYTFPSFWTSKAKIDKLRLYLSGYNLLVWDHVKIIDPEAYESGMEYPLQRVFSVGLNLQF